MKNDISHTACRFDALQLFGGQNIGCDTDCRAVSIYQSTLLLYKEVGLGALLLTLEDFTKICTLLQYPARHVLKKRIPALEGGAAA